MGYRGRFIWVVLRSAAVAVVPGFALALGVVWFLMNVIHLGCTRTDLPGVGSSWDGCPDGIGFVIPAMGVMALVGATALVLGVRKLAAQLADTDAAAARFLARDLAVLGALPLVLVLPAGLIGASSGIAVVLSVAVGFLGIVVLVLKGSARGWASLAAALVTACAAAYAFVAAPFALIPIALLVSAAVATRAAAPPLINAARVLTV